MTSSWWPKALTPSIQGQVRLRKLAGLFAGLGHLQPLLLATTNFHYLLDRFCMERCCSSEYISRIVTSLIFMEVMATLLVACLGVYIACTYSGKWEDSTRLNNWNKKEEPIRGYISSTIQCLILVGYIQILYAFTTGGRKGHMHWFYVSLMIQQFVCLLVGGAIGFWEGGVTLWYLMAIPMGPIPVFFYQLMIHSWIRNNGPRNVEYIVVEWQIGLALCISTLATLFWTQGYVVSYIPIELDIATKGTQFSADEDRIATGFITLQTVQPVPNNKSATGKSGDLSTIGLPKVTADVHLTGYSLTLVTVQPIKVNSGSIKGSVKTDVTANIKAGVKIVFSATDRGTVTVLSATKGTGDPKIALNLNTSSSPLEKIKVYSSTVNKKPDNKTVEISLIAEGGGTISTGSAITTVTATIPVEIKVQYTPAGVAAIPVTKTITSVSLKLPAKRSGGGAETAYSVNQKLTMDTPTITPAPTVTSAHSGQTNTLSITVRADGNADSEKPKATFVKVSGHGFTPIKGYHSIYSVVDKGTSENKRDIWAAIVGQCSFAACYKKRTGAGALLCLYLRSGGGLTIKYFGTNDTSKTANHASNPWYEITKKTFYEKLPALAGTAGSLSLTGTPTPQYNRNYNELWKSPVWLPLVMHGMAVGSFGSIFPNLIPKTLVCPKTSRTLSVVSIFLSPLPGIFNVMFADNGWPSAACAWTEWPSLIWQISWLLYIFYGLAFLFAIFNVHSPEWRLCCYIRSHGWMPFMMTLSITLIIEILIAIARAGIMMQKPAADKDKNHPLLWNKIFCLMGLSYLPFWLTTTPMMKSYVSSLDPFLCDKDRDHWPTARYGA